MPSYTALDTYRNGSHRVIYCAPRPPTFPASYPIPAAIRKLITASEAAWVDLELAHAEWIDVHDALDPRPRSADADREIDAWDALVKQADITNAAAEAAVTAAAEWAADHRTDCGAFEVARLADFDAATVALAQAQQKRDDAAHAVGRSTGLLEFWLRDRYNHDDKPRSIRRGVDDGQHLERVRAYWTNCANGDPEDTPLPGDSTTQRGFPVPPR